MNDSNEKTDSQEIPVSGFDAEEVYQYLNFLTHGNGTEIDWFNGAFFQTGGGKPLQGLGKFNGTLDDIIETYIKLKNSGEAYPTFHVSLNVTLKDGKTKERAAKDFKSCRVFCVDIDNKITREDCIDLARKYKPGMIVESSPGKFHLYWQANKRLSLDEWKLVQAGLTAEIARETKDESGGDFGSCDVTRLMRVPGMTRITKDGVIWQPQTIHIRDKDKTEVWTPQSLAELIPRLIENGVEALEKRRSKRREVVLQGANAGKGVGEPRPEEVNHGDRNRWLYNTILGFAREGNEEVTEESCLEYGRRLNARFASPMDEDEAEKAARSGWKNGIAARDAKAAKIAEAQKSLLGAIEPDFTYDYSLGELKQNRFTEASLVERAHQKFKGHILRIGRLLYAFDARNRVWLSQVRDNTILNTYAKSVCIDVRQDSEFVKELCCDARGNLVNDKLKQWQRHFSTGSIRRSIVASLETEDIYPTIEISDFDSDPNVLYSKSGVLNMRTGEVWEAKAQDLLLHQTKVEWRPEALCPWWLNYIDEVFAKSAEPREMLRFIQEVFGYSLSGSIEEQKVFVHYGSACNGKSKILLALRTICGGYSSLMGGSGLSKKKNAIEKEFERVGVKTEGKRCMVIDDLDTATQWNSGTVKRFTGPVIPVRNLYAEERDIPNRAKFHFGCNSPPEPESEDLGIIRRICIIPYNRTFKQDAVKEREILKEIEREKCGILNWAVEGWKRVCTQGGIRYPVEVIISTEEYREEHFSIEQKLEEMFAAAEHPPQESITSEWHLLSKLVEDVNDRLISEGIREKKVSPDFLGRYFREKFNATVERKWVEGSKKRLCNVKLLYQVKNRLNEI